MQIKDNKPLTLDQKSNLEFYVYEVNSKSPPKLAQFSDIQILMNVDRYQKVKVYTTCQILLGEDIIIEPRLVEKSSVEDDVMAFQYRDKKLDVFLYNDVVSASFGTGISVGMIEYALSIEEKILIDEYVFTTVTQYKERENRRRKAESFMGSKGDASGVDDFTKEVKRLFSDES